MPIKKTLAGRVAAIVILVLATFAGTTAHAATCTLNIEQAYQKAVSKGWGFQCLKGVLHFDNQKRPGCSAKPAIPNAFEEVRFLKNSSFPDSDKNGKMRNGWRLKSYQISGGQWSKRASGKGVRSSRINFTYSTNWSRHHRRYLTKIVMEKSGGDCSKVYNEAF